MITFGYVDFGHGGFMIAFGYLNVGRGGVKSAAAGGAFRPVADILCAVLWRVPIILIIFAYASDQ